MRSTAVLLLLFGAIIGVSAVDKCELYKVPEKEPCEIVLKWKSKNDQQATATCLEYFPTTFVRGTQQSDGTTKCRVEAAYQCVPLSHDANAEQHLMFDKCYYFPKDSNDKYVKGTIADYQDTAKNYCKGGKLSVFYSYTNAKFVGMKAHSLGIDKLWIGIDKDGKRIDGQKELIISKLWKLREGDYWDGEQLKTFKKDQVPDEANYYFMRTLDDNFNRRFQGSFERASAKFEATFACEFEAKFTGHQKWYCDKMQVLGLDAVYDEENAPAGKEARCLYLSASAYAWKGTKDDMKNIKSCQESPSDLHSTGFDDGTARAEKYEKFKYTGTLRVASYIVKEAVKDYPGFVQGKCKDYDAMTKDQTDIITKKWRHLNHHGRVQAAFASLIAWTAKYPKNECSDLPGDSSTMGVRKGEKIDMSPEVRARAVCSITFFQECENREKNNNNINPCGGNLECKNTHDYQTNDNPNLQGFFTCKCPGDEIAITNRGIPPFVHPYTKESDKQNCKWSGGDAYCAWMHFADERTAYFDKGAIKDLDSGVYKTYNDMLVQVVVRDKCWIRVRAHQIYAQTNYVLLSTQGMDNPCRTCEIPHKSKGTLSGIWDGMAASNIECQCESGV